MTEASSNDNDATPILAGQASYLIGVAGRAPSLHNTQPLEDAVTRTLIRV